MKPIYKVEKVKVDIKETTAGSYFWYKIVKIHNRDQISAELVEYLENWECSTPEWDPRFNDGDIQTMVMELSLNPFTDEVLMEGW